MTKFADQLYTDLMREHGSALADSRPPAVSRRRFGSRRVLLATGAGGIALAATAGALVATVGAPASVATKAAHAKTAAYELTASRDGAVTLAVYQTSGYAQVNAKLRQLDDNVVVVPVEAGCPPMSSLPAPAVPGPGQTLGLAVGQSGDGSVTVNATGVPAGDILVVALQTTAQGRDATAVLTSPPAPSCVSLSPQTGTPGQRVRIIPGA
jgi:hypothetical protein